MPTTPSLPASRRLHWALAFPKLGIVLLVAAMLSLLWQLRNNELEEERASLIKDVLWLEQNLRFHFRGNEEQLQQLAADLTIAAKPKALFQLRAAHLLKNNPEISQLVWLDTSRRIIESAPGGQLPDQEADAFGPTNSKTAFETALLLGHPHYSEPIPLSGNRFVIETLVPVFSGGHPSGMLVVVYPLDALLGHLVPWWFTEKYRVAIVDENEVQYATKTQLQGNGGEQYSIPFDPPGYGMKLQVTRFPTPGNSLQRLFALAIVLLAAGIFWSLWIVRDLMKKRTHAEEALRAEHAFRKAMEDSLTVGMRARDLRGKIIYVNPAFCEMTGFTSEELVGQAPPMPYWVPEEMDETYAMHQTVLAGEAPPDGFEITFRRKSGEHFQALIYEAPLIDGKGQHTGWMASVLDITERRRAEDLARQQQEQLQFSSRLITMGEMASTLAHELNQPLAAIASYTTGCLNLLGSGRGSPEELRPALEKIGIQAQRAGKIIRRVHDFVRKSEPKRASCAISEVIDDCIAFVESEARKQRIRLTADILPSPPVLADRVMLEQVLLNLIRNGMEAMANTPEPERQLSISCIPHEHELKISVRDNGCGIAPEIRDKLFTAFLTTKSEGMGIGLSVCRSIIELHRGRLWAEASPEAPGTIFHFTLPLEPA